MFRLEALQPHWIVHVCKVYLHACLCVNWQRNFSTRNWRSTAASRNGKAHREESPLSSEVIQMQKVSQQLERHKRAMKCGFVILPTDIFMMSPANGSSVACLPAASGSPHKTVDKAVGVTSAIVPAPFVINSPQRAFLASPILMQGIQPGHSIVLMCLNV